jgi:coproporphyrinogen III oxidase-like Fe-S oxidoreductase
VAGRATRGPANRIAAFVRAVVVELQLRADVLDRRFGLPGARPALGSLYLGGGTPSLLPAGSIEWLIEVVRARYGLADDAEVTLEANPGSGERGDLAAARAAGVTRLSIGAQSFDPAELRRLGRRHHPEDIADTVAAGRQAGIASVSLDLLYDVPGQSPASWSRTLDQALALAPDHLSLYALTLDDPDAEGLAGLAGDHLPLRPGARRWRERARRDQDDDRAATMYELADRRLGSAERAWYELSNWARPGHRSRHNLAYWERRPYEAVGPGAHAFDGRERRWNVADLDAWLAPLLPGAGHEPALPAGGREVVDERAAATERAILALRTADGLPIGPLPEGQAAAIRWAVDMGLLGRERDRLVLTLRGRLLSNELFVRLL